MPTTEERLAALEKQMAAWIDQQPTNYYTHQYSGEEIDNAVSRSLPNGAIDQAAGTFARPNLLDNWYFGRPVDQKGGYIVPKGVNYYKVDGFVPQGPIPETVKVDHIDYAGSAIFNYGGAACYVPKDGGYVRGYTGNGYSVDRWILNNANINVKESELSISSVAYDNNFSQKIESKLWEYMVGKTITISFLVKNITGRWVVASGNNKIYGTITEIGLHKFTDKLVESVTDAFHIFSLGGDAGGQIDILAAKLELGPTQTLAHRKGDRWVINEVPNYGDQLRRCLRHDYILGNASQNCPIGIGTAYSNDSVVCVIQLPEYMRTNPAVVLSGEVQIRFSATQILTATSVLNYGFSGDKVQLYFPGLSGLTPGQYCDLFTQIGSRLEFNSNL